MHTLTHRAPRRIVRAAATFGLAAATVAIAASASVAAPGATYTGSAAGQTFECVVNGAPVAFTTTGGTIHAVNQMSTDATGNVHFTGTVSLQQVSATDGATSTPYSIVGASWYGGSGSSPQTATVRDTAEFNILGPQGKVADVHAALTFYPDGSVKGVMLGDCVPPQ